MYLTKNQDHITFASKVRWYSHTVPDTTASREKIIARSKKTTEHRYEQHMFVSKWPEHFWLLLLRIVKTI